MILKKIIFALLIISGFTMCTKRTEMKIVGVWKIETVGQDYVAPDASWTFYSGGDLKIYKDINALPTGTTEAQWEAFSRSAIIPYIEIKGTGAKAMDGKWRVEKLNKKMLILTRVEFGNGETAGSFLRREFLKQ